MLMGYRYSANPTVMTDHFPSQDVNKTLPKVLKVLVIEDDVRWRTWVESNLESAGHQVFSAPDGIAGLELAATGETARSRKAAVDARPRT